MEDAATPLPREETTPPVTKIYFGVIRAVCGSRKNTGPRLPNLQRNASTKYYPWIQSRCQPPFRNLSLRLSIETFFLCMGYRKSGICAQDRWVYAVVSCASFILLAKNRTFRARILM